MGQDREIIDAIFKQALADEQAQVVADPLRKAYEAGDWTPPALTKAIRHLPEEDT
jgi:hypothetical protein